MFFPEFLYKLSQRDQQVTWLDPLLRFVDSGAVADVNGSATVEVDEGRALLLQHVVIEAVPGGAQRPVSAFLHVRDAGGNVMARLAFQQFTGAAGIAQSLSWQGSLVLTSGNDINVLVIYDAGVAGNTTRLSVGGMLVPIANVQRV